MCFGSGIIRELVLLFLNIYFSKLGVMLLNGVKWSVFWI